MATYVIVGGVAGGATAAARLRRRDESAHIIVLERGEHVSFANCGLPYYIGDTIAEREALLVSTPERLGCELALDVRVRSEVVGLDRQAKEVEVLRLDGGERYRLAYDKLILSPGARPVVPRIPGADLERVFTLRTIPDSEAIKREVDEGQVRRAAIIGAGFIGLELAENLVERGVEVTVIEMLNQVLAPLDFEMAALVQHHLRERGVHLLLGSAVERIERAGTQELEVITSDSASKADMVILTIGVRPESELAEKAGLKVGKRGHIVVNEHMQTSDPDIYAIGDVVEVRNPLTGKPWAVALAGPANRQARIAADHITGRSEARYEGTWGVSIVKVFSLTVGTTGMNARALEESGIPFLATVTHSYDHVAYYPGAKQQSIKLLYTPDTGQILGAQVVGYGSVDRTIDALATAQQAGMTVFDLETLELAYAPPYGAARDPVNVAGCVAANCLRGDTITVEWRDVSALMERGYGLLDVRTPMEYAQGHIAGAINVPLESLRERLDEPDITRKWIAYCKVGRRAYLAERIMRQHGFDVVNLTGGLTTYLPAAEELEARVSDEVLAAVELSSH